MEVIVEGEVNIEKWKDKNDIERSSPKITIKNIKFIFKDKKPEGQPGLPNVSDNPSSYNPFSNDETPF